MFSIAHNSAQSAKGNSEGQMICFIDSLIKESLIVKKIETSIRTIMTLEMFDAKSHIYDL